MSRTPVFRIVDLAAVALVVAVAGSLALANNDADRRERQVLQNSTQLRGIHQAMVTFAQSNGRPDGLGWFPGVSPDGVIVDPTAAGRIKSLIDGDYFTSDYCINPLDRKRPWENGAFTTDHFSYALLRIGDKQRDRGRLQEWRETINSQAAVMSDRNTGDASRPRSLWTRNDPKAGWAGATAYNDNHLVFEPSAWIGPTKYGDGKANTKDHLFKAAGTHDAMMVFEARRHLASAR